MATLNIYEADAPEKVTTYSNFETVAEKLSEIGVTLQKWVPETKLKPDATEKEILSAFEGPVKKLRDKYGFQSADVISLHPNHPNKSEMRKKFLSEHTHSEDEARYFIEGEGLFYVHVEKQVYGILCEKGDLINVPKNMKHWFDMGEKPTFRCIRVFTNAEGWVAKSTGSSIANNFPTIEK